MSNDFGGPSTTTSFLTGLAASTMNEFKSEHDRQQKEDDDRKKFDYQILMKALDDPNLTPSQAREIMSRSVDIFKPKGHGGIKDQLKELFGKSSPYEMQAGRIIQDVSKKPRLSVSAPTETETPGGTGAQQVRSRTVSLPPPPQFTQEQTFREQGLADDAAKQESILKRQMEMADLNERNRREQIKLKTAAAIEKYKAILPLREVANAEKKLKERIVVMGGDPNDPDPVVLERALLSLREDVELKQKETIERVELMQAREKKIDADIDAAKTRIAQGWERIAVSKQAAARTAQRFDNDPQVKGGWQKVGEYKVLASGLRKEAAVLYAKGDITRADKLRQQAEVAEGEMQNVINRIEDRQRAMSGVSLPAPPTGTGTRRGAVLLTEKEIRDAGGTNSDVEDARRRGVLAIPKWRP